MADVWYCSDNKKTLGPFTLLQLKAALPRIPNAQDILVWRDGFKNWQRAGSVPELFAEAIVPPSLPINGEVKETIESQSLSEKNQTNATYPGFWWKIPLAVPLFVLSIFLFFTAITGRSQALLEDISAWLHSVTINLEAKQAELNGIPPALSVPEEHDLPSLDDRNDQRFNMVVAITMQCINGAATMAAYSKKGRIRDYIQFKIVSVNVCFPAYAANMKVAWPSLNNKELGNIYERLVDSAVPKATWDRLVQQASRNYVR
jgi:GYF domain 2